MSADFDKAIDGAVREMLDVEPPAGLRRRVVERLPTFAEAPAGKPASGWAMGVVATAALVLLAIFLARETPRTPETIAAGPRPPVTAPMATAPVQSSAPELPRPRPATQTAPVRRVVVATAAPVDVTFDAPPAPGFPRLPALSVPELSVSSIQRVAPVEGPNAIAPDPIATPSPLAIEPLPADGRQSQE
jgi:hypothetical protein